MKAIPLFDLLFVFMPPRRTSTPGTGLLFLLEANTPLSIGWLRRIARQIHKLADSPAGLGELYPQEHSTAWVSP